MNNKEILKDLRALQKKGHVSGGIVYKMPNEDTYSQILQNIDTQGMYKKDGKIKSYYIQTILNMENGKKYYGRIIFPNEFGDDDAYANTKLEKLLPILAELKTFQFLEENKYFILDLSKEEQLRLEELKKKCV